MEYESPRITELGSIAEHTFAVGYPGHEKGGGDPQHLDKHCEWSGGSDIDKCDQYIPPVVG